MFELCPQSLKEVILRLLQSDRFVEAKIIFDQWQKSISLEAHSSN